MTYPTIPLELLNPFDLTFVADDYHAIAFFSGHPEYECVEAMFSSTANGCYSARAILTRHDQTQIDHVNDDARLSAAAFLTRTTVERNIHIRIEENRLPVIDVAFESHANEHVALRLACASPPDPRRGGLTDPGRHAIGSSLPIMYRASAAIASPASKVAIDGVEYPIPEVVRAGPHFVAHHGYFTELFAMAAIRSGTRELRVVTYPRTLTPGERWGYETNQGRASYEIESVDADGRVTISAIGGPSGETLRGMATAEGLILTAVELRSPRHRDCAASLRLLEDRRFVIGVHGLEVAVAGSVDVLAPNEVALRPAEPPWAIDRSVRVRWQQVGDVIRLETRCGGTEQG